MKADIAILAALPLELDACLNKAHNWTQLPSSQNSIRTYYQCDLENGLHVIAACGLGMGQINAALLTKDVISDWHPSIVILVGITGGLSKNVQLGDIIVSEQIVDYELGKITPAATTPRWSVYRGGSRLIEAIKNYKDERWTANIAVKRPDGNIANIPQIHVGVILSGNKVIADEHTAGALRSVWNRALAFVSTVPEQAIIQSVNMKRDNFLSSNVDALSLRASLSTAFSMSELAILASDLSIDWDNIPGNIKDEKIVGLIAYMKRRSNLDVLIKAVEHERPGLIQGNSNK